MDSNKWIYIRKRTCCVLDCTCRWLTGSPTSSRFSSSYLPPWSSDLGFCILFQELLLRLIFLNMLFSLFPDYNSFLLHLIDWRFGATSLRLAVLLAAVCTLIQDLEKFSRFRGYLGGLDMKRALLSCPLCIRPLLFSEQLQVLNDEIDECLIRWGSRAGGSRSLGNLFLLYHRKLGQNLLLVCPSNGLSSLLLVLIPAAFQIVCADHRGR